MEHMGHSSFNEKVWAEIKEYRNLYARIIKFDNTESDWCYITQTPALVSQEAMVLAELGMLQNEIYKRVMSAADNRIKIKDIKDKNFAKQIALILNSRQMPINNSTIIDLIRENRKPESDKEKYAINIYKALRSIENDYVEPKKINEMLTNTLGGVIRTTNIKFLNNVTNKEENIGYTKEMIPKVYKEIVTIAEEKEAMPITKATAAYFAINNGIIFDKENELTSILQIYTLLNKMGFKDVLGVLNFIEIIMKFESNFKEAFVNAKADNGDLTYIYKTIIDLLRHSIRETYNTLDQQVIVNKTNMLSKREQNLTAQEILRKKPELSMKQALFYVNHSESGKSYTINDFKSFNDTSYETSRYSMDNLVKIGYYNKIKIGKKFVYNANS